MTATDGGGGDSGAAERRPRLVLAMGDGGSDVDEYFLKTGVRPFLEWLELFFDVERATGALDESIARTRRGLDTARDRFLDDLRTLRTFGATSNTPRRFAFASVRSASR